MLNDHSIGTFDQVIHFAAMILHKVLRYKRTIPSIRHRLFHTVLCYRLIFPYLVVLLMLQIIMKYFHHNSIVEIPTQDHITCQENMWRNMLFIDTFFPVHERVNFASNFRREIFFSTKIVSVHAMVMVFQLGLSVFRCGFDHFVNCKQPSSLCHRYLYVVFHQLIRDNDDHSIQ